jgi:hypothetical protein
VRDDETAYLLGQVGVLRRIPERDRVREARPEDRVDAEVRRERIARLGEKIAARRSTADDDALGGLDLRQGAVRRDAVVEGSGAG